jgi:hypothetical protein
MSVDVTFRGRLGNNLFQYALGRIIAEHHGFEFQCKDDWPFRRAIPRSGFAPSATFVDFSEHFPHAPTQIKGKYHAGPVESFVLSTESKWNGNAIDLQAVLNDSTPRKIHLCGHFQRYEYFEPYQDRIRQWFQFLAKPTPFDIAEDDVLINIRRGIDFGRNDWVIPLTYYDGVLSGLPSKGRVFVCGTCIDEGIKRRLAKYDPIYYEGTPLEHFSFIMRFNRIVLSNSTFVWWAAFLSHASELYAPRSMDGSFYAFTGFEDVDLHMRETRYKEVAVDSFAKLALFIRNQDTTVILQPGSPRLIVQRSGRSPISLNLDEALVELLAWLIQQSSPLTFNDLRRHYSGSNLNEVIALLVRSDLLRAQAAYIEIENHA